MYICKNIYIIYIYLYIYVYIYIYIYIYIAIHTSQVSRICWESQNLSKHLLVSRSQCAFFQLALSHYSFHVYIQMALRCLSHIPVSATISSSLSEAITFHLVSCKISLFFHSGKLNHLIY